MPNYDPTLRAGDQALVREINLSLILRHLHAQPQLSRAQLAEITGLNKSTVSSLVQELLRLGFVHETGFSSSGVGRPSMMLQLNPEAGTIVSGEIGVDFITVIVTNFNADVLWHHHEETSGPDGQSATITRVLDLLRQAVTASQEAHTGDSRLLGMAVGVPGLIDQETGLLLLAPNLRWRDVRLRATLEKAFPDVPVFVENEANMAALGEHLFGVAQGYDEVLFISAGVGLGGAIVREGRLHKGKTGFAGEFGHMTMDPNGLPCNCGNRGCWETLVSQSAVFRTIRQAVAAGQTTNLGDQLSIPAVADAARTGDAVALAALESAGRHLGIGAASLVNALNPDLLVFGGILSNAGDILLPHIEKELAQRALPWTQQAVDVRLAQHGSDATVMGGVAMVVQTILSTPGRYAPGG